MFEASRVHYRLSYYRRHTLYNKGCITADKTAELLLMHKNKGWTSSAACQGLLTPCPTDLKKLVPPWTDDRVFGKCLEMHGLPQNISDKSSTSRSSQQLDLWPMAEPGMYPDLHNVTLSIILQKACRHYHDSADATQPYPKPIQEIFRKVSVLKKYLKWPKASYAHSCTSANTEIMQAYYQPCFWQVNLLHPDTTRSVNRLVD